MWMAALFYGQAQATAQEARKIVSKLGLVEEEEEVQSFLTSFPSKGLGPVVPTDPLIYRLYEIMQVYGFPFKAIIHEKFGDGIMSAIDFTMDHVREISALQDLVIQAEFSFACPDQEREGLSSGNPPFFYRAGISERLP
jgi:cyanase